MMYRFFAAIALTALMLLSPCFAPAEVEANEVNVRRLLTPPDDTAEAARVRIWLPLERNSKCRVRLNITDDSGRVVRHVINQVLGPAYYNFYWDKRNDSGDWVSPGQYRWIAEDCAGRHEGTVSAIYQPWERQVRLESVDSTDLGRFILNLDSGSVKVNLVVRNHRDYLIDSLWTDTTLGEGRHYIRWAPPPGYAGDFYLQADVGGFIHRLDFHHPGRSDD